MAGHTATIVVQDFRRDWDSGLPIRDICERWTITKDQFVRLRDLWELPIRRGCGPKKIGMRGGEQPDPTPQEIEERARTIRAGWSDETELARRVSGKPVSFEVIQISTSSLRGAIHETDMMRLLSSEEPLQ